MTQTDDRDDCDDDPQQRSLLLCQAAERFMNSQGGYFSPIDTTILADDFVFRGPVIGPLVKTDYIEVLDYFRVYEAFPDVAPNCFGFVVDQSDPLKVRFFVRATGTYQNPLRGFLGMAAAKVAPPDGRDYRGSTEAWSILFDDEHTMLVRCLIAGYVVDRFEDATTTGGRGLTFGILSTLGIPLPTAPGSLALRLNQWVAGWSSGKGGLFPRSVSDVDAVPRWWTDSRRGADI